MEEIMLSMSFTDEEAEAIKKAFAQTKQYPPLKINVSGARENILTDGEEKETDHGKQ